jgi:ABC-type Mn2+/Zn2+ transport system permease subunit
MSMSEPASLVVCLMMAAAAGIVGCFAVMRRMTLAADAVSHVALPGIALASILGIDPMVGAVVAMLLGMLAVWAIERGSRLATETAIGVIFSAALAAGSIMITSGDELIEALFGGTRSLEWAAAVTGALASLGVIGYVLARRHALVLTQVSPEIARTAGIDVERESLLFLLVFATTVALGLRYLGVLLMGSLIIIPAAVARRTARDLNGMLGASVTSALLSTGLGSAVSSGSGRPQGPCIVLVAALLFLLSLASPRPTGSSTEVSTASE